MATRSLAEGNRFQRRYAAWAAPYYARMAPHLRTEAQRIDAWLYGRGGVGLTLGVAAAMAAGAAVLKATGLPWLPALALSAVVWLCLLFSMLAAWEFRHHRPAYGQLEHKATFLKRALEAGLPVPPELTLEQAMASRELFIVKDPDMDLGAGVELMDGEELKALEPEERAVMILQPRLRNHPVLRALYPPDAPLSTLRVTTTLNPTTQLPEVTRCAMRMGRAGSLVDNTARGGIWSNVNLQDGTLTAGVKRTTFGKYKDGKALRHEVHPDTGKRFVGLRVPWFEEGKALALEAHQKLAPDALTLGWDIALWEERPVLLEVNVWTVVHDYDPPFDAFTPGIQLVLERLKQRAGM